MNKILRLFEIYSLFRTSHKLYFASYWVKVNEMRSHQSPVTDEEELHLGTNPTNSSPSNSQSSAKTPKPSLNLAASMLDNSRMKTPSRAWEVLLSVVGHSIALAIIVVIPLLYTHSMDLSEFRALETANWFPRLHRGQYSATDHIVSEEKSRRRALFSKSNPYIPSWPRRPELVEVAIDSVIDEHGNVTQMKVVSGNPLLVTAALNAVEQWKYQPTLLNGQPIAVDMEVTVTFKLGS